MTGKVLLDGEPLKAGTISFRDESDGDVCLGNVGEDGQFSLRYRGSEAVPTGTYKITLAPAGQNVDPAELMKNPEKYKVKNTIPKKYQTPNTTDLAAEVKPGPNEFTFEMVSK